MEWKKGKKRHIESVNFLFMRKGMRLFWVELADIPLEA